jgi:hypothetical protein
LVASRAKRICATLEVPWCTQHSRIIGVTCVKGIPISYIIVGNGTDAGVYLHTDAGGAAAIAAAELTLLVTLTGVSDTSKLNVDNFADFLA